MSLASDCCSPCQPTVENVPGPSGSDGAAGAAGSDGLSSFTLLTADATFADAVATVQVSVASNEMFVVGQTVFAGDPSPGTDHGTMEVISLTGTTVIGLRATAAPGDTALPYTIGSGGKLTATGATGALSAALPTSFTDNTGGTPGNTLAAGVGISQVTIHLNLDVLAVGAEEVTTDLLLGYAFEIIAMDYIAAVPGAGVGADQTFTVEIGATPTTGGVLQITLANSTPKGNVVSATAITGNNIGTAASVISIVKAGGGTQFSAGDGSIILMVKNLDTANAIASLADHVDDLITALT